MNSFASHARWTCGASALFAALALLTPAANAAQSFNLCDPADRTRFNGVAGNTYLNGVRESYVDPGQTLTIHGSGFLTFRPQDLRVRLLGFRPNTSNAPVSNMSCYIGGPSILRLVAPTVNSDTEMQITLPTEMVWGLTKPVKGLFNATNIDLVYQSPAPCTESEDHFGGIVAGLSYYRLDPPVNLESFVRSTSEYDLSWEYSGDDTALTGFRVYDVFCENGQRVCIIPDPVNFKDPAKWRELTNPNSPLPPDRRSEPINYVDASGRPVQGGRSFITMTAYSKHCGESPPSRLLDTKLVQAGGGGGNNNETQTGVAMVTIGYYLNQNDANGEPILTPFPYPPPESNSVTLTADAIAYYDNNANADLDAAPANPMFAFPFFHDAFTQPGDIVLNYASGYAGGGPSNSRATIIVHALLRHAGSNYFATAHLRPNGNTLEGIALLAGENAALTPWRIMMVSGGFLQVTTNNLVLPSNGQAGRVNATVSGRVDFVLPQQQFPGQKIPPVRTFRNDITIQFDLPLNNDAP
jgi:hypothetical protein